MESLSQKVALFSEIINLAFKLSLFVGGAILMVYGWRIDYLPKNITISDGFFLTSLAMVFGIAYGLFILSFTSLGIVVKSVFLRAVKEYKTQTKSDVALLSATIDEISPPTVFFAFLALFLAFGICKQAPGSFIPLVLCVCIYTSGWSYFQHKANATKDNTVSQTAENQSTEKTSSSQFFILGACLLLPLFVGGFTGLLVDGVMRLSHFRADVAVVHVKQPYVQFANEHGLLGTQSGFGSNFQKFTDVKVLLSRIGTDVVIEFSNTASKNKVLIIPADHIHIISGELGKNGHG